MHKIKSCYINFIEKEKKTVIEQLIFSILFLLSLGYGFIVFVRNLLYNIKTLPVYKSFKRVISVGNISWSGSGKTTVSIFLYNHLNTKDKVAILRRGYGNDEGKLFAEKNIRFFSSKDRVNIVKKQEGNFDIFILDDGFQYRKLARDINIVIMSSREFCSRRYLIPASFYREPLSSLRRADILIINYKEQIANIEKVKGQIKNKFKHLEIYTAAYGLVGLYGLNNERIDISELNGKKLAGLCAIGYPEGFFNLLKTLKLNIVKQLVYPDHYEFGRQEFEAIQDSLLVQGINTVVITHKDKFHLPDKGAKINFYIAQIKLAIDEEDKFFSDIEERLRRF